MSEYPDLPEKLSDWTIDTVINLVKKYEFEPSSFDYKETLNPTNADKEKREEHRESIRRTVCSMANTNRGFILIGVRDRKKSILDTDNHHATLSIRHAT
jgi:predicted HTH transcriptional regulator